MNSISIHPDTNMPIIFETLYQEGSKINFKFQYKTIKELNYCGEPALRR